MIKIAILLIAVMVISVGFLSGCIENEPEPTTPEPIDTDGDGYPDDEDDYPNDSNLYLRKKEHYSSGMELESSQGNGFGSYIDSDVKYVEITWEITSPQSLTTEQMENIEIGVLMQPYYDSDGGSYANEIQYTYDDWDNRNVRIIIDETNWGDWHFAIRNKTFVVDGVTVTATYEIYYIK